MSSEALSYSDISKERRNLMAMSIALTLYMIAGGSTDQVSLMSGAIKLQRPEIVIVFAWIALYYFYWRYRLYSKSDRGTFNKGVYSAFASDVSVLKWLGPIIEAIIKGRKQGTNESIGSILRDGRINTSFFRVTLHSDSISETFPLPYFKSVGKIMKYRVITSLREKNFSDYMLPYWLFIVANIVGMFKVVLWLL